MLRPRRLGRGSRVAVVAPASPFRREDFEGGVAELRRIGFEPVWDESVFAREPFVAGAPDVRASAIRRALTDPDVDAIIGVRGGYGSAQLLPLLDPAEIRAAAKPVIGYSDLTTLLSFVTLQAGLVSFHGTMLEGRLARGEAGYDRDSFERALCVPEPLGAYEAPALETLSAGSFSGPILGGTVTNLLASLGTPWAFDPPNGYVLFFEEVGERPYRLDRMVLQLRQAGLLSRAGAVVIGELLKCDEPGGQVTARATMAHALEGFPGPVVFGFPSGHTTGPQFTIPFGVRARVLADGGTPRVIIEEPAVQ
ncbi:MAG: LD-carboxypeptidase [Vicinamibacterales bacterium]